MKTFKDYLEEARKAASDKDPRWDGYKQLGMKDKKWEESSQLHPRGY